MIHWKKQPDKPKVPKPKRGDTKVKRIFLWFPFLHTDGEFYWLGFVDMEYIYTFTNFGFFAPFGILAWSKWRIVSL